jgi:hypothetical protein
MTNGPGKSDRPTVVEKSPNNAGQPAAEGMEGRGLAKGNLPQQNASRTPSREDALSALERVRQAASKDKKLRFTALLHHIYNPDTPRRAYLSLKKEASTGVDGETWRHYGETLEDKLQDLSHRLKRGAYRAKPVRDQFRAELTERMQKFNLELHPEKTRLLEFGPYAIDQRRWRREGKPETFNFLGFTHICVKKRSNGRFTVLRQTIRKRLQTKLNEVKSELQRRMHEPISEQGKWLRAVVGGHFRYYGVPMNQPALTTFRFRVGWYWHRSLSRRSQNGRGLWHRMRRLITRWLPLPSVCHPYPLRRMGVVT